MHTCSSKEKEPPFGNCFERELRATASASRRRLGGALPQSTSPPAGQQGFAWQRWSGSTPSTSRRRGSAEGSGSALAAGAPKEGRQELWGPAGQPPAGARRRPALPAGGRAALAQRGPRWCRQVRGRCPQVEKSGSVAPVPRLSPLFSFADT